MCGKRTNLLSSGGGEKDCLKSTLMKRIWDVVMGEPLKNAVTVRFGTRLGWYWEN